MKKKTILISGGYGRYAKTVNSIADKSRYEILLLSKDEMNVTDLHSVERAIDNYKPDYFVHAAALTRPMINHKLNPSKSILNNIIGTSNVTIACLNSCTKLIYLSTDYVYPGKDGDYSESSPLLPVNKYAWSKLGGECAVTMYENSCILRLAMTEHPFPHKQAIVDSFKSSISIKNSAIILFYFLDKKGIYNIGGDRMSIYEFAKTSNKEVGKVYLKDIKNVEMAIDSSMNLSKMKKVLKNDQTI